MMRWLTKEELYRFDGTPLFPERRAYTASYELSPLEADLYQAVTTYVREEMNRADRNADGARRNNVGFALQILQRRLASSPAAIHRSLERRRKRLEDRLREERIGRDTATAKLTLSPALPAYDPDELDEAPGAETEELEEKIVDSATAAQTLMELEAEITILKDLEARALRLKLSGQDAKWRELENILDEPHHARCGLWPAPQDPDFHRAQGHARISRGQDPWPRWRCPVRRRHSRRHRPRGGDRCQQGLLRGCFHDGTLWGWMFGEGFAGRGGNNRASPGGSAVPPIVPSSLMWPAVCLFEMAASAAPETVARPMRRMAWRLSASSVPDCRVDGPWPLLFS